MRTTRRLRDHGFVAYAFGAGRNLDSLDLGALGVPVLRCDAEDPAWASMHTQLLRLNARAYGGLAMPAWVQLDCGVLPSAFVGWGLPPDRLPTDLAAALGVTGAERLVPVAEALAVPSAAPGRWVSWSLCAVLPGHDLGFASKLLSLAVTRAAWSTGIVQLDGPALRVHTRFGPLAIELGDVPFHTRPETTVIYGLAPGDLDALDAGATPSAPPATLALSPGDVAGRRALAARIASGAARAWIVAPGRDEAGRVPVAVEAA